MGTDRLSLGLFVKFLIEVLIRLHLNSSVLNKVPVKQTAQNQRPHSSQHFHSLQNRSVSNDRSQSGPDHLKWFVIRPKGYFA